MAKNKFVSGSSVLQLDTINGHRVRYHPSSRTTPPLYNLYVKWIMHFFPVRWHNLLGLESYTSDKFEFTIA